MQTSNNIHILKMILTFFLKGVTFNCPHCESKYEKKRDLLSHLEVVHENEVALV